tara:strand:+ start:9380 stop:10393 length:1014 start_codon:yes stop_codon:yes gene_type:complete
MEKKTISINPDLFTMNKKKRSSKKKTKKIKPKPLIKPNVMQKELLKRIKSHQNKIQEDMEKPKETEVISENEFDKHLSYLTKLKQERKFKKKLKKKKRETKKNPPSININTSTLPVNNEIYVDSVPPVVSIAPAPPPVVSIAPAPPPVVSEAPIPVVLDEPPIASISISNNEIENQTKFELPSAPPYSCLKGSSIPTYREWKKNTRKNFKFKDDVPINTVSNMDISDMNIEKTISKKKVKKKKYTKRTYTLGKAKDTNNVGVLIKSNNDRRVVQEEIDKLKNVSLKEVKDYLRKHCLIKVGSNAPNDVLRKIYEDSILSGEINNKTKGTLLHNYMNE